MRYKHFTNEELLVNIDDKRRYSPLIDELALRLEKEIVNMAEVNHKVECPVCSAQLEADLDLGNGMFTIQLDKS